MQLNTKHFGMIEIDENGIISFEEGIPGFEHIKKFVLLGSEDQNSPFQWLQSVDYPERAFVVIDPFTVVEDYSIDVDDNEIGCLEIESINDVAVFSIVVIPEDINKMTANLRGPVIINTKKKKGKQVLLDNSEYSMRHYLLEQKGLGGTMDAGADKEKR